MSHHPLNPGDRVLFKGEYAGQWATVHEGPSGLNVFQFDGESYDRYIAVSTLADLIDRVVPAQSGKDPFAVGEWVVAKSNGAHINEGQLVQITQMVRPIVDYAVADHFFADGWYLLKSRFRPATQEEISAHLEKNDMAGKPVIPCDADPKPLTSEDCELKITSAVPLDTDANGDGKITFTVAGRKFFVGQRVYSEVASTKFEVGSHLELLGAPPKNVKDTLICREVGTAQLLWLSTSEISLEPPPAHEWQFGDQASHPKHGKVLVISVVVEMLVCASPSDPEIFIDPSELTFIRRTDLGE